VEEVAVKFLKRWKNMLVTIALVTVLFWLWLGDGYRWAGGMLVMVALIFAQAFARGWRDARRAAQAPLGPIAQGVADHWLAQGWAEEACPWRCRKFQPHIHLRSARGHLVIGGGV
jgi:hypothetical protein